MKKLAEDGGELTTVTVVRALAEPYALLATSVY
jgi:hypothetical protein